MSEDSKGGAPKKLSTKDILAAARAQAAKAGGGEAAPAAEAPAAPAPPPAAAPAATAAEKPAAKPQAPARPAAGGKPKSTAEILAAARAQAAGEAAPGAAAEAPAAPVAKPQAPAKPAAGGKPKSTADILAAARATAGKGGAPEAPAAEAAPGEKPLAKEKPKAPAKGAPAVAAEGPKLSVQEMLAAVRPSVPAGEPGAAVKPARPAGPPLMPQKPTPAAARPAAPPPDTTRRNIVLAILLSPFVLIANLLGTAYAAAWTMLAATTGIATLATARFMLPNVLIEPPSKFKIGPPADYDLGTVATKLVAQYGVWIVHTDGYKGKNLIYALISVCTHLGCTPSWLEGEQKFKCPCHGSGFYITGINFEGPAPRPLERAGIRLSEDGMLEVDKSVKFQEEMGQWNDPASYYEVVG